MPLILLVVVLLVSVGGLTIRYLTYESGPHHQLPNVCASVHNDALRQVVGDVQGQHKRDDDESVSVQDSCQWGPGEPEPTATIIADRDTRHWNASSIDRARAHYRMREWWVQGSSGKDSVHLDGADESVCRARLGDDVSTVDYRCAARDANVVISIQVIAPTVGVPTLQHLLDLARAFAAGLGRTLLADLVEDL